MVANDQAARENDCSQARSQLAQQQNTPLGLLLGGTAFVLILLVTLLALASIERNERAMSRLLAEKGSSLIMAFESMLRTSMRGEARVRLQILLKEMASTSDVQFIAVTMPDGTILAHSNGNRLGEILRINGEEADEKTMKLLAPGSQTRSAILNMEGQRVFVVYRYFMQPPPGQELPPGLPQPIIFLGLDLSPFEITRSQDRDHVFMLAGVAMLVGLACLLALYYAQRARESRRRQRRAEGEIRRLEEEIRRKEKLAAVGTLAAGVAHSIRNPLTGLKLRLFSFTRGMELSPAQQEDVQAMNEAVRHMEAITSNFLEFSRRPRLSKEPLDMSEVLDRTLILLQPRMEAYKVTLRRTRHAPLPRVDGDAEQLREALANLIINACEAAGTDGEVRISEERGRLAPLGPVVVIRIEDSGPGVPEELHEVIFQPFMSTKVEGTGLGLPIARRIFEEHGGWLHLHNAPGHGASFVMVLPVRKGDDVWLRSS